MFSLKKRYAIFALLGSISLITGLLIYLLFRENSYVSILVAEIIPLDRVKDALSIPECDFIKYYLPDYLWALSLTCWLHVLFMPGLKGSLHCTLTVFLFGLIYELLQYFRIIGGTGDIADVMLYLLAGLTVNILNLRRGKNEESY